jgi:hypothetical protein
MTYLIKKLWGWLWGIHICEEFTQWDVKTGTYHRPRLHQDGICDPTISMITYTKRWQERRCTICGKMEQRELAQ